MRDSRRTLGLLAALLPPTSLLAGCIRPPDVVLLDRKTVLEEQASGELYALENELREEVIVPKGVEFTRGELREAGADLSRGSLSAIVAVHAAMRSDLERVDDLLVRRCVGEAQNGLLVETPGTCAGRTHATRVSAAVQRVNRARRQLWRWMHEHRPESSEEELRERWRAHHLGTVVCGGQVQDGAGRWEPKRC